MREAFDRLGADLRAEIRSGDAATLAAVNQLGVELRGEMQAQGMELRGEIQTSAAGVLQQMLQQMGEFESRMRRHFDVAAGIGPCREPFRCRGRGSLEPADGPAG